MMPPRIDGFRICQSLSAALVTVTKSVPKNTRSTPSTANSRLASGDGVAVVGGREIQRPLLHDHPAREELQGRRIGRLLGLDKQTYLLVERVTAVPFGVAQAGDGTSPPPLDALT